MATVLNTKYYSGGKMEKNEIGGAFSMHGSGDV
jgi:hypothetical protein